MRRRSEARNSIHWQGQATKNTPSEEGMERELGAIFAVEGVRYQFPAALDRKGVLEHFLFVCHIGVFEAIQDGEVWRR